MTTKKYECCSCCYVGVFVVVRFSIPKGSVVSQPVVMKLFTHINENILRQAVEAIMADFF